jgi:hypothetical protein
MGSTGGYRIDQVDDLTWLGDFSITRPDPSVGKAQDSVFDAS